MDDISIGVVGVSKTFKLPHEKQNSIKSLFVNLFRGRRSYEKQQVLKDISFEIKRGEFFGIVGRNGSGKSTLLKLLAGIYTPDSGVIQVNGKLTPFIELGVGFNPELTGRENVFLNGALLGFNRKEMDAMYDEIVRFAELGRFMDQKLKNYSSGMQVRLAFSIAIRADTEILILDEVLAVGDASFQQKCFNYFEKLKTKGKTVVLVTHDMGAVRRFCTSAIYLKNGKIIFKGNVGDVADMYIEDNLESQQVSNATSKTHKEDNVIDKKFVVTSLISEQQEDGLTLEVEYSTISDEPMYVGISVQKDGVSIAEITTDKKRTLSKNGKLAYRLDTGLFNGGSYAIGVALFKLKNQELVAVSKCKCQFSLKVKDQSRGAALKLDDTWKYNK